jgi:putative endonuclease
MSNTTSIGLQAESAASSYLMELGYEIIERNVRTRFYELDIVATRKYEIVLVEVKYRKNSQYGGGLYSINQNKLRRLQNGFNMWLSENPVFLEHQARIDLIALDAKGNIEHLENITD